MEDKIEIRFVVPSVLDKEIEIKKFKEIICTTSHTSVVADFKPQLPWVPPPYLVSNIGPQPQRWKTQECPEKAGGLVARSSPYLSVRRVLAEILIACPVDSDFADPNSQSQDQG